MINIEERDLILPLFINEDTPVKLYANFDTKSVIPANSPSTETSLRYISIKPKEPARIFNGANYSVSLEPSEGVTRFLLDSSSFLSNPSIIDNLNIFNSYKSLKFFIASIYDSKPIPLKLTIDLYDVLSIVPLKAILTHPSVSQLYTRADNGYKAVTYDLLLSLQTRTAMNLRIEFLVDFRLNQDSQALLNLHIKEKQSKLLCIDFMSDDPALQSVYYKGKAYRRVHTIEHLSKPGYFFVDENITYLTSE